MISLILPYWDRQAAADLAFATLAAYAGMDLEVIVVDDGTPEPFRTPPGPLNVRVLRLPTKGSPRSCITAWNRGVEAARGDIIAISCVEVQHPKPVLEQMAAELERQGPDGYVLAAAWCPEHRSWHCHSTHPVPTCPPGTGLSFLGMLHRSLWDRVGGFDEDYAVGVGYEDRDFIWRMHQAGAKFVIRDDLMVIHPKTGATIKWPQEMFARNEEIYRRRWMC